MPPTNTPPASSTPPASQPSGASPFDALQKDPKFMDTLKTLAIYGAVLGLANVLVMMIVSSLRFAAYYSGFSVMALVYGLISGAVGGAIGGVVFYFLFEPVHNWIKRTPAIARYIHSIFTLFWIPFLVVTVIMAALGLLGMFGLGAAVVSVAGAYGAIGFGSLFIGWIIALAAHVAVYYWYSKEVSAKLAKHYTW